MPMSYGVDWTEQASPITHCWFPYIPADPSSSPTCSFITCKNPKPTLILSLIRCESCLIVVHTHHLSNLRTSDLMNSIPACRPSFSETNESDKLNQFDRHFWSNVTVLSKPCAFCKRKSTSSLLFGNSRPKTVPTSDMLNSQSPILNNLQLSGTSSHLQCLWCSRGFHRRCWEQLFNYDEKNKCDYGVYR
jgi:hypothetical protein